MLFHLLLVVADVISIAVTPRPCSVYLTLGVPMQQGNTLFCFSGVVLTPDPFG